ncbi:TspO MBR domain containing protein [Trichuris trichiura]|uniref:TspO MBR domain containing protein n=1 Tax=Trichuris trichiura TaxID=36087 RepID=A0A077ZJS4_TRITR|nr:TspO MBR domain containing protein [Trichuris trichiura]
MWDFKQLGIPELDRNEWGLIALTTTAVCGSTALLWGYYKKSCKSHQKWWNEQKKPSWGWLLSNTNVSMLLDSLSFAGIPAAIYFAYKQDTDRKLAAAIAMVSGGALLACSTLSVPVYMNSKDLQCLSTTSLSLSLTSGTLAVSLYNINRAAGILILPSFLWCAYCFLVIYGCENINVPLK